jgi:hypothetical protein
MNTTFETTEAIPWEWIEAVKREAQEAQATLRHRVMHGVTLFSGCNRGVAMARERLEDFAPKTDPSWGIRHVRQRGKTDCGLAVAAMLAGVGYSDAADADPHPDANGGMSIADCSACLETLGFPCKVKRASIRLAHASLPANAALLIRKHSKVFGHWIATDGRLIFDPEDDAPVALREYRRADWSLIRIVERR